jgi:hypothetical protein
VLSFLSPAPNLKTFFANSDTERFLFSTYTAAGTGIIIGFAVLCCLYLSCSTFYAPYFSMTLDDSTFISYCMRMTTNTGGLVK